MKIAGIALILLGLLLGAGAIAVAMRPSVSPLVTVIGAFALPAICIWAGVTLMRKGSKD